MAIKFSLPKKDSKSTKAFIASTGGFHKDTNGSISSYPMSTTANVPLTKNAQMAGAGASVVWTQPMFFSPLHTPQNWQIASKRREIYQWLYLPGTQVLMDDFTYVIHEEVQFGYNNIIEDKITGGVLYEDIEYPAIMDSEGKFRIPVKASERECTDKRCFSFSALGNYGKLKISEEHPVFVLDGDLYRKKIKIENGAKSRLKKGVQPNGVKKVNIPDKLIKRIQAQTVASNDYLLTPVPEVGQRSIAKNRAWTLGYCIADGLIAKYNTSCYVRITGEKEEKTLDVCAEIIREEFGGKVSSYPHGDGNGWRISASRRNTYDFFASYIKNKGTHKKFDKSVFGLDKESRLNILGGYFDGDGSFNKKSKSLIANNYSKDMADQLYWILLSCDILCSILKIPLYGEHYPTTSTCCYRIIIASSEVSKLQPYMRSDKIPNDFEPKKKRNLRFFYEEDGINYLASPISEIKQFYYTGKGFDIEMTNERKALVANGYVCSNCRFYYENEPKVGAGIDFYSMFPMNGFKLECKNAKILRFYEKTVKNLQLNKWLKLISHEYFLMGDAFPFLEISCEHCNGSGTLANGQPCNHAGGSVKRILVLNPDSIEVQSNIVASEPVIALTPDEELKMIVQRKEPKQIYDRLPKSLIAKVSSGQPIPLSNRCVSHLKHNASPYGTYGTSLLRRLFTILAYKTKLMTANWIIAERLILPVRVVKIGDEKRPAGPEDIADVSNQLASVANDPNLTLVTHHAFDYEYYGATGKIHNINNELEYVGKEILDGFMLNQALLNGEMASYCHKGDDTLTLTDSGFKHYWEIDENDKIACYNPQTKKLEYHRYIAKHVFDYDDDLIHFETGKIDIAVTPNHKMYSAKRDSDTFEFIDAKDIKRRARFIGATEGFTTDDDINEVDINGKKYDINLFCELLGYYISEGYSQKDNRCGKNRPTAVCVAQSDASSFKGKIIDLFAKLFNKSYFSKKMVGTWNPDLSKYLMEKCGDGAINKKIPVQYKNLPPEKLEIILESLVNGDGSRSKHIGRKTQQITYHTISKQLAHDVAEIAFKCGYVVKIRRNDNINNKKKRYFNKNGHEYISRHPRYAVYISKGFKGRYPTLDSKAKATKNKEITKEHYTGKVYCFEVPHHLFVTMRNGICTIQGNSSAQIGVEVMIRRLESWRTILAEWVENHILLPIAMMQGFIDEEESKELGETVYLYPKLKWEDLNLRDTSQEKQMFIQMHDKKLISSQTLLEQFELDYDSEVQRLRDEQVMVGPEGQMGGGMPGGMDMGGGMPMDMGGGMPPGGDMGAPDMGGGMDGGMDMGGGMGAPGGDMGAAAAVPPNFRVNKKGKGNSLDDAQQQQQQQQPKMLRLTDLERRISKVITELQLPFKTFAQYKVAMQGNQQPFVIDFALPEIGIGIETDGKIWHEQAERKARDNQRDRKLASIGWRILRFKESAIKENIDGVKQVIIQHIKQAVEAKKKQAYEDGTIKIAQSKPSDIIYIVDSINNGLGTIFTIGA